MVRQLKLIKGTAVYKLLTAVALRTQPPVIAELVEAGADYRPYWISNMIWAHGDQTLVESLARRPDVARIHGQSAVQAGPGNHALVGKPDDRECNG